MANPEVPQAGTFACRWFYAMFVLLFLLISVSCGPVSSVEIDYRPPVDIGRTAIGAAGAVASVDGYATHVGIEVLRAGGNAIDAAIAIGFVLAVTHPQAGNLGGGGFMVIYLTGENRFTTIDFREKAPASATQTMYLGDDKSPVRSLNGTGWLAVGVPGTVAGFAKAHEQWGQLPWPRLVQPAIHLAAEGFHVNPYLADSFARVAPTLERFEGSAAAFLHEDGSPYAAGERFIQPDLAWSLQQISQHGADGFYQGELANRVAAAMEAEGGLITIEDLAAYEALERQPIRGTYRDYEVVSMGPPSSGGTALVEMLNILENFDVAAQVPATSMHLMIESMRQAYLDRAAHLGDADFIDVPLDRLTSKDYAREVAAAIPMTKSRRSADLGEEILVAAEPMETTHYSVVDGEGNAVSTTYTIEAGFGAKVVAPGTGFLLNNEMGDFNEWPGVTNENGYIGTTANLIEPGKRPLSSMTPTILARDGRPIMLVGSPGGKTIINTVLNVIMGVVDHGRPLSEAVAAPRIHHQWMPDRVFAEASLSVEVIDALREMGHDILSSSRLQGDAHSIFIYPDGARLAVADPRRSGAAAAY